MNSTPDSPTYIGQFDAAYRASQPPAVRHLMDMPVDGPTPIDLEAQILARRSLATALASSGYLIDSVIMIDGWDAYFAMFYRQKWSIQSNFMGTDKPIPVSTSLADFPPYQDPVPPITMSSSAVGKDEGNGYFGVVIANLPSGGLSDGQDYTQDPRGEFVYHKSSGPFGTMQWFTKSQTALT